MNRELPAVQAEFRKGRGTRGIANCWITQKARQFQKCIYFFIDYAKAFDCVDHNKLENSERDSNIRPPYLPPEKPVCRFKAAEPNMEQWAGSNLGKECIKTVYCHPAYLTSMQSTS